jgi:ribose/xylose/arabinose/galactoside ABC-type transport system permease subunit
MNPASPSGGFFHRHRNEIGLALATTVVVLVTASQSTSYSTALGREQIAQTVLRESAMLGIFALGAATVIIAGGIDLSAGSVIAFSGAAFAGILVLLAPHSESGFPLTADLSRGVIALAVLGTLVFAFLIGSFHAWLITVIELPPFVATLASLVGLRSLAKLMIQDVTAVSHGQPKGSITLDSELLLSVGNKDGWWVSVVICAVMALGMWVLLSRSVTGRHLYAMGGNEEAARLSGIRTVRLKWLAYCISSMTAAVAGILYACYIGTANPTTDGLGYELNAIAAAVVGGCSLAGGVGTVAGVMLGAMFLRVVVDSVAKLFRSRPDLFEGLVVGVLVVLAVAFNELRGGAGVKKQFFPGVLGLLNVFILTMLSATITAVTSQESKLRNGLIAGGAVFVVLTAKAVAERLAARRPAG